VQILEPKKIHLISIGGSIMHDLAINLKAIGNIVTGSDDKIYDPVKKNLKAKELGLYPIYLVLAYIQEKILVLMGMLEL